MNKEFFEETWEKLGKNEEDYKRLCKKIIDIVLKELPNGFYN